MKLRAQITNRRFAVVMAEIKSLHDAGIQCRWKCRKMRGVWTVTGRRVNQEAAA